MQADVNRHGNTTATFTDPPTQHLGGAVKIGKVVDQLPNSKKQTSQKLIEKAAQYIPESDSKTSVGISVVDGRIDNYRDTCFQIKKRLRQQGYRPRIVLGSGQALSSAQVLHNQLDGPSNAEILVCVGDKSTLIAKTNWVQDIESYSKRDMQRPCRDMQTGMLPPKLAQIMVNLAGGDFIYDPFCGSGVILQEALLMGKLAGGSDIEPKMIDCTRRNLDWLSNNYNTSQPQELQKADARDVKLPEKVSAVVTEGYLGPIMHQQPKLSEANKLAKESDELLQATLKNLHPQLSSGTRLCLAAPAWHTDEHTISPTVVDDSSALGYNHLRLEGVSTSDLLYKRESQYVGRQLILLERN